MEGDFAKLAAHPKYRERLADLLHSRLRSVVGPAAIDAALKGAGAHSTAQLLEQLKAAGLKRESEGRGDDDTYESARVAARVRDIGRFRAVIGKPRRYLDVGCGNGSITAAIGAAFGLQKENIIGCDVGTWAGHSHAAEVSPAITFKLIGDHHRLDVESGSVDLITVFMTLHHIRPLEDALTEIARVLGPDGVVVVREHDSPNALIDGLINIEHALFETIIEGLVDYGTFQKEYYGRYKTRRAWTALMAQFGFFPLAAPLVDTRGTRPWYGAFGRNPAIRPLGSKSTIELIGTAHNMGLNTAAGTSGKRLKKMIVRAQGRGAAQTEGLARGAARPTLGAPSYTDDNAARNRA